MLVCNGKNQYQAREDLDAFLGEKTEEFVSWYFHRRTFSTCICFYFLFFIFFIRRKLCIIS